MAHSAGFPQIRAHVQQIQLSDRRLSRINPGVTAGGVAAAEARSLREPRAPGLPLPVRLQEGLRGAGCQGKRNAARLRLPAEAS